MAVVDGVADSASVPRYRRYFEQGQTVFLTLATANRRPWLAAGGIRDLVPDALRETRSRLPFTHHGHVLPDDHVHLLIGPQADVGIPDVVGNFKRGVMARRPAGAGGRLWRPRYHDHIIRDADDFARRLDYLHFNPVKHGLAADAAAWRWSSFHAWKERGVYPDGWGRNESERIRGMAE
jgi:putative transposase